VDTYVYIDGEFPPVASGVNPVNNYLNAQITGVAIYNNKTGWGVDAHFTSDIKLTQLLESKTLWELVDKNSPISATGGTYSDLLLGANADDRLWGNGGDDTIKAGRGDDSLEGGDGNDQLYGGSGRDSILGGSSDDLLYGDLDIDYLNGGGGNDQIIGGRGHDELYGGVGKDTFVYSSILDSKVAASARDTIYDFTSIDTIDLTAIDANAKTAKNEAFSFISTKAFTGKAGELRFDKLKSDTYIYGDTNGDGKADFAIHLDDPVALLKGYLIL
jgi:serralysin